MLHDNQVSAKRASVNGLRISMVLSGSSSITDPLHQRLVIGQAGGLADRTLGPVGVAAVELRQAADIGNGVVVTLVISASGGRIGLGLLAPDESGLVGAGSAGEKPPKRLTGVAAPRLVPGAMAAIWQA